MFQSILLRSPKLSTEMTVVPLDTLAKEIGINLVGNLAYMPDGEAGLQILDVCFLSTPKVIGSVSTTEYLVSSLSRQSLASFCHFIIHWSL